MTSPTCRFHALLRMAAAAWAAAVLASCAREPSKTLDADPVVARVNDAAITLGELKAEIASIRGLSLSSSARGTSTEVSRALRLLIERAVVLKEGERLGVAVANSEVEEEIRRYRTDFPPGGLEKSLLQEGLDMESWRSRLRTSILYRKSAEAIAGGRAEVTEEEVRGVYRDRFRQQSRPEQVRVRQLLFASGEEAAKVRATLLTGRSADDAVGTPAEGEPVRAVVDLGFLSREELPQEIAPELFDIPVGGVSGVIRREGSFSVFQVVEKKEAREVSFEEAGPEIRAELLRTRREEAFRKWLEESVAAADVRVQESIVAELAREGE